MKQQYGPSFNNAIVATLEATCLNDIALALHH